MPLLLILILPLAEIAGFIVVGKAIGVFATLALTVAISALGLALLRDAGALTVAKLQRGIGAPQAVLAEGGVRMGAGLLLLVPGFVTDLIALALLIPGVGRSLLSQAGRSSHRPGQAPSIIEGDFERLDPPE